MARRGGYDRNMGARPMERVIQEHIKKPLADMVLFGALSKGGIAKVTVDAKGEGLSVEAVTEQAKGGPRLSDPFCEHILFS